MSAKRRKAKPAEAFVQAVIPVESHIVTRDGRPCTLINVSGMHRGGVLLPGAPVAMFDKYRDAARAINRTQTARAALAGSLVSEWIDRQLPSFIAGTSFEIMPCGHQKEPEPTIPSPAAAAAAAPRPSRQIEMEEARA